MRYSLEQLKVVYKAGKQGLRFDEVLKFLELLSGEESLSISGGGLGIAGEPKRRGRPPKGNSTQIRIRQNGLGQKILAHLLAAGEKGSHVKEISNAVGSKQPNVVAWVYSTGKKLFATKELKKVAPATFSYVPKKGGKSSS